jgi:putative transposase
MPQSLSNLLVHLVFSTKDRNRFIVPEIETELHKYLAAICHAHESPALTVGGTEDHVHLLCALGRTIAVADLIEEVKTSSSKWMKNTNKKFFWQRGYGAFSIGESNRDALMKYIANQKQHHRRVTFQVEYRSILRKYKIPYDERYVWD